jgi:hypothetical protein
MSFRTFSKAIASNLPVLFVNVGWAINYDGTETISGNHQYLRQHPKAVVGESAAFGALKDGIFKCGIGVGELQAQTLHVVLVARDPGDRILKVIGLYAAAEVSMEQDNWAVGRTRFARRIPVERRQPVLDWPGKQGMRRWALRNGQIEHAGLFTLYRQLTNSLKSNMLPVVPIVPSEDAEAVEGELKTLIIRHRHREQKHRRAKLSDALNRNNGRLICEVPTCRFDFHARYGELGAGFAEVHHKLPLGKSPPKGRPIKLSDLAVVCANCHRMIHRNGQCRSLDALIP